MGEDTTTIGARLRELRRWRRMTLAEVAGLAGISTAYLSMAERGLRSLDRRSTLSALAAALRVSETELTGGPHLGTDRLQSAPHAAIPALRVALSVNAIGEPAADRARPLPEVTADLETLRLPHGAGDYLRQGAHVPGLLDELYFHVSDPVGEAARITAAAALADACTWSASMAYMLRYPDLAQLAARSAVEAARLTGDPVRLGMAQFERIGTAPRSWDHSLVMAERAANALQPHACGPLGFQVLGMLTLRCALAAAAVQNGSLAGHWLAEAQALAGRVDDSNPACNWEWFGATNVAVWRVAIAVERGRYRWVKEFVMRRFAPLFSVYLWSEPIFRSTFAFCGRAYQCQIPLWNRSAPVTVRKPGADRDLSPRAGRAGACVPDPRGAS